MDEGSTAAADSFAAVLRAHRAAANLTQEELSERSGLSVQAISMLERGLRRAPRSSTVASLADAMRLDPAQRRALVAAARTLVAPAGDPDAVVPGQLPRAIGDFTGRGPEVELLASVLGEEAIATRVVVLTGAPGVGKTALALHAAHRMRSRFPDGQLFVDLRGAEGEPLAPADVLAGFLRALGVDGSAIPPQLDARAGLYRARVVDRRLLVVLDNAADEAQVRELLPSGVGCSALVTSRAPLSGLEAVRHLPLGVLADTEAVDLLARVAGRQRAAAEPASAREIVRLCGGLPLAVRIAGARLAARPRWPLRTYAARLADERGRLDELRAGDLEVRASLALAYRALDDETARGLRMLGVLEAPHLPAWLAGALLGVEAREAEALLERLVDAHLLEATGEDAAGQPRYRLHSLVRLFARERGEEDGEAPRLAALERAAGAQLALAERAHRALSRDATHIARGAAARWTAFGPGVADAVEREPLVWFEAERACLVAGVAQSARAGLHEAAWELAASLSSFLSIRGYWQDWQATHELVIRATRAAGDRRGELQIAWLLADSYLWLGDAHGAQPWLERALALAAELGDGLREALATYGLALASTFRGEAAGTVDRFERALAYFRSTGDGHGEAIVLIGLTQGLWLEGRRAEAAAAARAAHTIFTEDGDRYWEAVALLNLGELHRAAGRQAEAERTLTGCVELFDEFGNRRFAALGRYRLAMLEIDRQGLEGAAAHLEECIRVFRELCLHRDETRARERLEAMRADRSRRALLAGP